MSEPHSKMVRNLQQFTFFDPPALGSRVEYVHLGDMLRATAKDDLEPLIDEVVRKALDDEPVLVVIDSAKMLEVLRIGREKLSDKGTASAAKRVDPLRSQTGLARTAIIDQLVATFRAHNGLENAELTAEDLRRAEQLVATKFATAAWANVVP